MSNRMNGQVSDKPTVLHVKPRTDFVMTEEIAAVAQRALTYLQSGFPVHFRGPAGTGKTTLALHMAAQIGQPVLLMSGDDEFSTSDLVGGKNGQRHKKVVDRYIHSVLKYEESTTPFWTDNRLTTACRKGYTLVYDEFTRSRPEANNILLNVLEERVLILPASSGAENYIRVHPNFRVIFTSNPSEYVGVHGAQDALLDRMITLDLAFYGADTEAEIVTTKAGVTLNEARRIVNLVRALRDSGVYDHTPTMRAAVMIGRLAAAQSVQVSSADELFVLLCLDVLASKKRFMEDEWHERAAYEKMLRRLIDQEVGLG